MPVLTFRVSVATPTPAVTPVTIDLISQARAIEELILWSPTANLDISKSGYRLLDRGSSKTFIPDVGSQDNGVMANPGEAGWAPIPASPLRLKMFSQVIEGPPYRLTLAFFNTTGAVYLVAGFLIVREPFAAIDDSMIYEFLLRGNPPREFAADTTQGLPAERGMKDAKVT